MQDGDNFFTKLDRSLLMAQLEKEQQEAAEKARKEEEEKEREARRLARERGEIDPGSPEGRGGGAGPGPGGGDPGESMRPREPNLSDDIEFKAIPADPMTVAETLVKVGPGSPQPRASVCTRKPGRAIMVSWRAPSLSHHLPRARSGTDASRKRETTPPSLFSSTLGACPCFFLRRREMRGCAPASPFCWTSRWLGHQNRKG